MNFLIFSYIYVSIYSMMILSEKNFVEQVALEGVSIIS